MGPGNHPTAKLGALIGLVVAIVMTLAAFAGTPSLAEPVSVAFKGPAIDLTREFKTIETEQAAIAVELPAEGGGPPLRITLQARGQGPVHRWVIAQLLNPEAGPRSLVIDMPHQGFASSGLFWPSPPGSRILGIATEGKAVIQPLGVQGADAYSFTMAGKETLIVALELPGAAAPPVSLWQRDSFDLRSDSVAFFRGAILGIALLLAIGILTLYGVRAKPLFLAAGFFALISLAFIVLDTGYFPHVASILGFPLTAPQAQAIVEGLMTVALLFCLVTFADLRRNFPVAGNALLLLGLVLLVLPAYAIVKPAIASGLSRLSFGLVAGGGFALIFYLWRKREPLTESAMLQWSAISIWTFIATVSLYLPGREKLMSPVLVAGLCVVLMTIGFTLAQYAFSHGLFTRRLFHDAGRRALALAGAQQYVWDWQPDEQLLVVGDELERALEQQQGVLSEGGAGDFLEFVHPADRGAYLAAIDAAERRGRGTFEQEFRLRRGDGTYRWFVLKARALPGRGNRALRCIGTLADITDIKRSQEQLLNDAVYDRVTGLPNRALLADRLQRAIQLSTQGNLRDVHALIVDLDRFKVLNEGLGHEAGDTILTIMGKRLSELMGPEDTVARLPGAQFGILFTGSSPRRDIIPFAEEVRRAVSKPVLLRAQEVILTACLGIANCRDAGATADRVLRDATIALYEAKRRGKDMVEFFRADMRDDRSELVVLEQDLRRAIERNEIEVHYQPIARLSDLDLAGFEALARWRHPSLGLLPPESFIALAEQTGFIKEIGRFVLNEATRQLGIWQRAYRPTNPIFVAVNVSSSQLIESDLVDEVKNLLSREGIRRETLKLEVTESIVMQYPERSAQILQRLKQLGVGLACDDFGTGFSSLSSLRRLPFDTLKVDRSFVSPDADEEKAAIILAAIVALAHELGLEVVAEGVETQEQVDRLGVLECDYGQGYFLGRPMSAKQVSEALGTVPYGLSLGKTVISILWERSADEPPPVPPEAPASDGAGQPRRPAPGELVAHPAPIPTIAAVAGGGRDSSHRGIAAASAMESPDQTSPSESAGAPDSEAQVRAAASEDIQGQPESPEAIEPETDAASGPVPAAEAIETVPAEPAVSELSVDRLKPRLGSAPMAPRRPRAPATAHREITAEPHPEGEADSVANDGSASETASESAEAGAEIPATQDDAASPDAKQAPAARVRKTKMKRAKREARSRDPQAT